MGEISGGADSRKNERDRFDRIVELVNWSSVRVYFFEGNDASE